MSLLPFIYGKLKKKIFFVRSFQNVIKYWVSRLCPVMDSIFDDVDRKILSQQKSFLHILKAYMMEYIITKFRDFSFFQSEIRS